MCVDDSIKATILRIDNGYIKSTFEEYEDTTEKIKTYVYQIKDHYDEEKVALEKCHVVRELLYDLLEDIGIYYSKHNLYNVRIDVVNKNDRIVKTR